MELRAYNYWDHSIRNTIGKYKDNLYIKKMTFDKKNTLASITEK